MVGDTKRSDSVPHLNMVWLKRHFVLLRILYMICDIAINAYDVESLGSMHFIARSMFRRMSASGYIIVSHSSLFL